MARTLNPRRIAHKQLKVIHDNVKAMCAVWSWTPGTDIYRNAEGKFGTWGHRDRKDIPASEYTENKADQWERLEEFMTVVAQQATEMAQYARDQRAALEAVQRAVRGLTSQ